MLQEHDVNMAVLTAVLMKLKLHNTVNINCNTVILEGWPLSHSCKSTLVYPNVSTSHLTYSKGQQSAKNKESHSIYQPECSPFKIRIQPGLAGLRPCLFFRIFLEYPDTEQDFTHPPDQNTLLLKWNMFSFEQHGTSSIW